VLANNNKTAEIKVVDNIGVAGRTQSGLSNGTLISEVDRLDAGIILKVTPSISSDGFVRMEISPEISQLSGRTTQINRDQTSPIITKRTVDTVVTVKDGQSVVIGGLIQTSDEERSSKVPILGDIPILGAPFRTRSNAAQKTELLVILTPRVIPGHAADSEGLVRDVTEQAVEALEDPGRVEDYLERVRRDIERTKARNGGYLLPPAAPSAGGGNP
jgi:general secretion pathway protein D